jgi:leucyl aminopeptidase
MEVRGMKVTVQQGSITDMECDAIIVNLFLGVRYPGASTGAVDKALDGLISRKISESGFKGELGEIISLPTEGKIPAKEVMVVGLGRSDQFGYREVEEASRTAAAHAAANPDVRKVATIVHGAGIGGLDVEKAAAALVKGSASGLGEHVNGQDTELVIVEFSADKIDDIKRGAHTDFRF